jgi:hypothetical protein
MSYTLTASPEVVIRDEDQAHIPDDPGNRDYQDYLAWLDEGNTPYPAPVDEEAMEQPIYEEAMEQLVAQVADQEARLSALEESMRG